MARNQEKAQSMLNRFLAAKYDRIQRPHEKRPFIVDEVEHVGEAERWRFDIIKEIGRKITQIQNPAMGEHRLREANDEINKLLREKAHWERRIMELGGPDFTRAVGQVDADGQEIPGGAGYKYFGAAKSLPGVKELLEKMPLQAKKRNKFDMLRGIDADYYGYRDDDDGTLQPLEKAYENEAREKAEREWTKQQKRAAGDRTADGMDAGNESPTEMETEFTSHVPLPDKGEIEKAVLERRKQDLLARYVSASLAEKETEAKSLLNIQSKS